MSDQSKLYLVDALPYVFRAFFSIRDMTSPQGHPVAAVYGFANFLLQLVNNEPVTHIAVAFDESLTTSFRNDFYPPYKANRELPPPDLERQLSYCQAVARALGMTVFSDQRYEADDIIGTLVHQASSHGMDMVVVSNDKDMMQLVTPQVTFYDFARERRCDPAGVVEHMGVRPEQITDFLGLQGDAVDNIPGVKGVGSKTALALLQAFPSLEAIYADLDQVETLPVRGAKALRRKLDDGRDDAFLSKKLATISQEAPAAFNAETLAYHGAIESAVNPLWDELGFQRLRQRIVKWKNEDAANG